jgi:hypothetical protein
VAIYTGRDWGYRGTIIRYNWIHDINSVFGLSHGVYYDDAASGMTTFGNIFQGINGYASMSGGGRDNIFENNIMVHLANGAHSTDRRARTSNYDFNGERPNSWNLLGRLQVVYESYENLTPLDHQAEPWSVQYPQRAQIPDDWALVQDSHWLEPEGCVFSKNVVWDSPAFISEGSWGGSGASDFYQIEDNLESQDPNFVLFVDEDNQDLNLDPQSPVWDIPGFVEIPFDQIGPR